LSNRSIRRRKGISATLAGLLDNIQGSMDGVDTGMNR
jgi:hypothetical protein